MSRARRPSLRVPALAVALLSTWALGCSAKTSSDPAPQQQAPAAAPAEGKAPADDAKASATDDETPPPLSEEDLALLAADPKTLTPEQLRARGYARRRQIMQDPDSPQARALNDLAEAHRSGEIKLEKRDGVWFTLPGSKPTEGRRPAGWRPPEERVSQAPAPEATPEAAPEGSP